MTFAARFLPHLGFATTALLAAFCAVGCASETSDDIDSTAEELRQRGDHGGHGGGHGGGGHGGHHGGGIARPHRGGRGGGQHRPGGHWGDRNPQHIQPPQAVYFGDINANGSGCPGGSWDVGVSDDGQTFTLAFNGYEAMVGEGQANDIKECMVDIKLGSPQGLSYAVASFYYQGYIVLDEGMTARQSASYFFENTPERDVSRNVVQGPFDDSYLFADEITPGRRVWSPCGGESTLHVRTRLMVRNNGQATGEGYINNSTVDGSLSFKWGLAWRRCR